MNADDCIRLFLRFPPDYSQNMQFSPAISCKIHTAEIAKKIVFVSYLYLADNIPELPKETVTSLLYLNHLNLKYTTGGHKHGKIHL